METPEMPLGKHFNYKERWVVGTNSPYSNKIYIKMFVSLLTDKNIWFQKNIQNRGKRDYPKLRARWLSQLNSKGLLCITQNDMDQLRKEDSITN